VELERWEVLMAALPFLASDEDSWSDGDQEPITVDQTWRGDPDSEADSIDSDQEDPLK
jgi:hypothetical protein